MKKFLATLVVCLALAGTSFDADAARRIGGGSSLGKRPVPTFSQKAPAPQTPAAGQTRQAQQPGAAQQRPGAQQPAAKPSMARSLLTGLAAALGISALLSLLGVDAASMLGNIVTLLLIGLVIFLVARFFLARRGRTATAAGPRLEEPVQETRMEEPARFESAAPAAAAGARTGSVMDRFANGAVSSAESESARDVTPVDFDREAFLKAARENYVKLQKAWDTGNVVDLSDFTTEDVFIAITHQLRERGKETYRSEVLLLENELLGIAQEGEEYLASVRFTGRLRINDEEETLDETWLLVKPVNGEGGWLLGGIRQNGPEA